MVGSLRRRENNGEEEIQLIPPNFAFILGDECIRPSVFGLDIRANLNFRENYVLNRNIIEVLTLGTSNVLDFLYTTQQVLSAHLEHTSAKFLTYNTLCWNPDRDISPALHLTADIFCSVGEDKEYYESVGARSELALKLLEGLE